MSEVVAEELGRVSLSVISGPCIAREVALKMPSAASVASTSRELSTKVRKIFETDTFTLFENEDIVGVELGGSVKNVIAICSGIVEGLGFGANTRAVLFARGVAEMARLGAAMGAKRETFMGLSGLGDLATTCLSPQSRNRWLGEEIGKGARAAGLAPVQLQHFADYTALLAAKVPYSRFGEVLYAKASRGVQLDKIIATLVKS